MTKLTEGDKTRECPKCGSSWDDGSIVETFISQRDAGMTAWRGMSDSQIREYVEKSYGEPYRWGRQIGIELPYDHPKHYDGVSYWQCPDCHTTWNRFTKEEEVIS